MPRAHRGANYGGVKKTFRGSSTVERLPVKEMVAGSSPARGANNCLFASGREQRSSRFSAENRNELVARKIFAAAKIYPRPSPTPGTKGLPVRPKPHLNGAEAGEGWYIVNGSTGYFVEPFV